MLNKTLDSCNIENRAQNYIKQAKRKRKMGKINKNKHFFVLKCKHISLGLHHSVRAGIYNLNLLIS